MKLRHHGILFLATGGYIGKIPVAPGTFGSALGMLLAWPVSRLPGGVQILAVAAFSAGAMWVAHEAEKILGRTDPGAIVIDEIAGILLTFLLIPWTASGAAAGFVLFRVFDIAKPFPIRWMERKLAGGVGVVADDLAAGVLANMLLRLFLGFFPAAA